MDIPLPGARDVGRTLSSAWFVSRCITVTLWPSSTSPLTIHAAAILPWFSMLQVSLKMSQLHYCLDWLPGTQKVSTFFCAQNKLNFVNVNHLMALHGSFSMWFRFPKAILKQTLCLWSSGQGRTQSCLHRSPVACWLAWFVTFSEKLQSFWNLVCYLLAIHTN